jgi:DnaJ like chaperone protein
VRQISGKVIAGLIGFLAFGPVGLLFGLVLGHAFDKGLWRALQLSGPDAVHIMRAQFFETTFSLLGFIAKSDGRVSEAEIAQTEALFAQLRLSAEQRRTAIAHFKDGAAADFDPAATVSRFRECLGPRRQAQHTLIVFLVGIALADGSLASSERAALKQVAGLLSMPSGALDQLISMLNAQSRFQERAYQQRGGRHQGNFDGPSELDTAYAALGLTLGASASEVKRRYRKLMSENHPDKLIAEGVPDELLKVATARAQEITAAYEVIQRSGKTK